MYLWFTNFVKTKKTTGKTINNTHRYTLYGLQSSLYSYDWVDESHVAWPKTARPSHQNLPIYSQKLQFTENSQGLNMYEQQNNFTKVIHTVFNQQEK